MSNFKKVVFKAAHLDLIDLRDVDKCMMFADTPEYLESIRNGTGGATTVMADGRILYIAAFQELFPGTFEVFVIPSVYVGDYAKSYVKEVKAWLSMIARDFKVRRFQTYGIPDDLHDRWLEALGFTCEGTLKCYTVNGDDMRIWRLLPE